MSYKHQITHEWHNTGYNFANLGASTMHLAGEGYCQQLWDAFPTWVRKAKRIRKNLQKLLSTALSTDSLHCLLAFVTSILQMYFSRQKTNSFSPQKKIFFISKGKRRMQICCPTFFFFFSWSESEGGNEGIKYKKWSLQNFWNIFLISLKIKIKLLRENGDQNQTN